MRNSLSSKIAATLLTAAFLCSPALAAPAAPSMNDALDAIGAYAPQALKEQGAPGMILAVTDRTQTLRLYPVGYAKLGSKTPVTDATRFGIGSLSKSMTATALLQLRDAGRFDPRRPVRAYLPWFSVHTKWRPITSHDLFTHTSGLPDGGLSTGLSAVYDLRGWMTGYAPGTHWSYSNAGYDTLGAILESLDRANYPEIMQRRIFAPLGMRDTTAQWSPQTLASAAGGYLYRNDDIPAAQDPTLVPAATTHFVDPAGSVLSTGADMAAYMRFLLTGNSPDSRMLSPQSYALLTSPGVTDGHALGASSPGMYHRYGYGLAIMNVHGDKVVAHTGGVLSYTACMMVDLTRGFGVIALSNLGYVGPRPCGIVSYAIDVLQAQAEGRALPAVPKTPDAAHVAKAAEYAGEYRTQSGAAFTVTAANDRLTLVQNGASAAMYPRGKDAFWVDGPSFARYLLQFGRDKDGAVVEAAYGPQWYTNAKYSGPRTFPAPASWAALTGEYEAMDPNGYYSSMQIYELKGKLYADGTELVPQGGNLFHIGTALWEPSWVRFTEPIAGRTQLAEMPGLTLFRTNPY
jgi:CubicO group peptidase (beta-lactamase class C family)